MNAIWYFLSTPFGMIILLIAGVGLILYAILKPEKKPKPLTQVIGQQYKNVTIILDWHEYINCEFTNCTFKWDVAKFKFQNCKVNNAVRFETQSKIVGVTIDLLKVLHLLGEQEFADNWKQVSADYFKKDLANERSGD